MYTYLNTYIYIHDIYILIYIYTRYILIYIYTYRLSQQNTIHKLLHVSSGADTGFLCSKKIVSEKGSD